MTHQPSPEAPGLFDTDKEMLREIYQIEIRSIRNKLLTIAGVILLFDILALLMADAMVPEAILVVLVIPALYTGLAFLALKEPMTAVIIGIVLIAGIWIYQAVTMGAIALFSGWLAKAIIIYLLLAAFRAAKEASRVKKQLIIF